LRIHSIGHYGIRADKPPNRWVIISGIIVIKSCGVKALAGELFIGWHGARPRSSVRHIFHGAGGVTAGVRYQGRARQVVLMYVSQRAVLSHGYQPFAQVIVACIFAGSQVHLEVLVDIEDGLAALYLHDAVAVAVIDEGGRLVRSLPKGELLVIPAMDHLFQHVRPDAFLPVIMDFLERALKLKNEEN
jgi:pimeloyl-ACP methyl ester carboxylesterase